MSEQPFPDTFPENIAPTLDPLRVAISTLELDPRNARRHPERNLREIAYSLYTHGQLRPVVVNAQGRVLAGNGLVMVAQAAGWEHVAAVQYDADEAMQAAFAIQDNRTAESSEWDLGQLADILHELKEVEDLDLGLMGWNDADLHVILQADWKPPEVQDTTIQTGGDKPHAVSFTAEQWSHVEKALAHARVQLEDQATLTDGAVLAELCRAYLVSA